MVHGKSSTAQLHQRKKPSIFTPTSTSTATFSNNHNHDTAQITIQTTKYPHLLTKAQLPKWYEGYAHIQHHYRPPSSSLFLSLESLTSIHNETINIYSHLLPGLLALASPFYFHAYLVRTYPASSSTDRYILISHLYATVLCMGMSAAYHTFLNHSAHVYDFMTRMDYAGIVAMIVSCFVTGIYVDFYCEPFLQKTYWTMIITLGSVAAFVVLHPRLQAPKWRLLRLGTFVSTGLSAFAPVIHSHFRLPLAQLYEQSGLVYYYMEGVLILLAAFIYATHWPERVWPGRFDIWGASHQIFHVLVVVANGVHFAGVLAAYDYRYLVQHLQCPVAEWS